MAIRCKNLYKGFQAPTGRWRARALLLVILAILLSGCSMATQDLKTPLAVPAQFSESGTSPLPDKWWGFFKDLALNTLIDQAHLCASSVISQCLFLNLNKHGHERDFKGKGLKQIETLAWHITLFSLAGIREVKDLAKGNKS